MTNDLFSFTGTAHTIISATNHTHKQTLVNVSQSVRPYIQQLENDYYLGVSFQIDSCRASFNLPSLPKAPYPNIAVEDTVPEKMAKIADVQAEHPWIGLQLHHQKLGLARKSLIAEIPLQNKGQLTYAELLKPYLGTGEVKLLGENDEIFISLNLNGQDFGDDDYIQIETDYSCTITGIEKPVIVEPVFDLQPLIDGRVVFLSNGMIVSLPNSYPNLLAISEMIKQYRVFAVDLNGSRLNSLKGLDGDIQALILTSNFSLNGQLLNEGLFPFTSLQSLRLDRTPCDEFDFDTFVAESELNELWAQYCNLSDSTIEKILVAFDIKGSTGGTLRLRGNNSILTVAATTAKDNLAAKSWTVSTD